MIVDNYQQDLFVFVFEAVVFTSKRSIPNIITTNGVELLAIILSRRGRIICTRP